MRLSTRSYFFLVFVIFPLIKFPKSAEANGYEECRKQYQCGTVKVSYPFYDEVNRPAHCGHPGFEFICNSENGGVQEMPEITVTTSSEKYYLLYMDPTSPTISVARKDFYSDYCPNSLLNATLDSTLFRYTDTVEYLALYFGCSSTEQPPISAISFSCSNINNTYPGGYLLINGNNNPPRSCQSSIVLPSNQSVDDIRDISSLHRAFRTGFELKWIADKQCDTCRTSGGECGYDSSQKDFICYCQDNLYDSYGYTCSKPSNVSKLKQRSQSPSLIDKLYELSADERSFIKLTQPEVVVHIKSLDESDSEQKGAPAMSQDTTRSLRSHDLLSSSSILGRLKSRSSPQTSEAAPIKMVAPRGAAPPPPPRAGLKRKLEMPIDVDAAEFSFDSLAPHVDTLLFPSFKDRQSSMTFADLSQEAAVQSFQSLQSCLGVLGKVSEFSRVYEAMKKERDALSDKYKAATEALKSERAKHRDCISERDGLKSTLKEAANEAIDAATYYYGKARLEMMEEFQQGKHEAWDYDGDKASFERTFPEGTAAPGTLLLSFADEEVNSPHNEEVKDAPEVMKPVAEEVIPADNMGEN